MQISRIARTHLVYQFIIITLLFLCIGYYELLLDKKFIFTFALVPIFFYQLVTLSCYTELLPVAHWLNLSEIVFGTYDTRTRIQEKEPPEKSTEITESQESKEHHAENFNRTETKNTMTACIANSNIENHALKPRTYKFRNWQTNCFTTANKAEQPPSSTLNTSGARKSQKLVSNDENLLQESDTTKTYFFPYRQKRLEKWIDSKGNDRPSKIRSRVSNIEENVELDSQPTSSTPTITTPEKHASVPAIEETIFKKSYSFPLRQRRIEQWREPVNTNEVSNKTLSMPYWHSVEYSLAAKQKARRRRSVSISNLSSEHLDILNNNTHREFSQSMEISDTSHEVYSDFKRSSPKVCNANFSKIKMGIMNCFSRTKKDNSRINSDRKETDCKMRLFKTFFRSRENLQSLDTEDNRIFLKSRCESKEHSNIYPCFVSTEKQF